ncbi:uncharacterized protein CDV56_101684 [Aspergillus thermomutatus]|uniref:Uncharacterized protein n=1 Tax=Aspergillus thermomutatus TaxID=41047 RepID=A0A397G504_ASPTH|nr:uncharacterized protein CDV56_101684 [Aspergillus thermomutatus]RHZ43230.1 hypothetical protein CDV56_101684 [Aspergillus thermomutatus]
MPAILWFSSAGIFCMPISSQVPVQHSSKGASSAEITTEIKDAIKKLDEEIQQEMNKQEQWKIDDDDEPVLPSDGEDETDSSKKKEIFLTDTGFPMPTMTKRGAYHTWVMER